MEKEQTNILILVADPDETARRAVADMLALQGYKVMQAADGGAAIKVVSDHPVDIAIFDQYMTPVTGLEFVRHVTAKHYDIGLIMVTDDPATDLLAVAAKEGIRQVMRKPVESARLNETVRRVLRAHGKTLPETGPGLKGEAALTPQDLMRRAIELAHRNAVSRMGGPFAAVVADPQGRILGEGVNSVTARCDPTAHAEVLAIRRATEKLNRTDLSGCAIYCASAPTMLGQALIISTGITKVYYALGPEDVGSTRVSEDGILGEMAKPLQQRAVPYEQIQHGEALAMFRAWQAQKKKISD